MLVINTPRQAIFDVSQYQTLEWSAV